VLFAFFDGSEVVEIAETSSESETLTLLGGRVEEESFILAGTRSRYTGQHATVDIFTAFVTAFLFGLESVSVSFTSTIMESVASTVSLVVVPLGHELVARSSVFGILARTVTCRNRMLRHRVTMIRMLRRVFDSASSSQSNSDRGSMSSETDLLTFFFSMESVGVSTTSTVFKLLTGACGWFIVI